MPREDGQTEKLMCLLQDRAQGSEAHSAELAAALADFILKLEPLIAGVWSKMASTSPKRRGQGLAKAMVAFLSQEDREGGGEALKQELTHLQQHSTALLTGISRAGEEFARRYADRFTPEAIRGLTKMEQGGLWDNLTSSDVKCWRKYQELAESLTPESIQRDIETAVGNYAEAFVRGIERLQEKES